MITSLLYVVSEIVRFFQWLFECPPLRVRRLEHGEVAHYVYGTVEKTTHEFRGDHLMSHWTVRWDDSPQIWETRPCHNFVWQAGEYTLLSK